MLDKFLREVITLVVGKPAEAIADILHSTRYVNEFSIAKKLDITINQTRNILYRISDHGLVSFIRKKDKKKGWYTYFWKIEVLKCLEFLRGVVERRIAQIENQVRNREMKVYYICERCNIEFNEENALQRNFTCPECDGIFALKDNSKVVKELKKHLTKYQEKLSLILSLIEKETEKQEKKREKELKKIEKEKAEKRRLARLERAKKKPAKKTEGKKKTPSKKVAKKTVTKKSTKTKAKKSTKAKAAPRKKK